jgi:hypothetical protein
MRVFFLAHCEPVTMVTPPSEGQPLTQDLGSKLEDRATRPQLTNGEFQELEELLTEYEYILAGANEDYGRTYKV